jgi:hypothetical protein
MELIIFAAALCVVGVLAMRFGYDSRVPAPSKEEDLAGFGVSLDEVDMALCDIPRESAPLPVDHSGEKFPPHRPIRRTVARALRALVS